MSVFLALVLALSLLPTAALAEPAEQEDLPQLEDALPEEQERNDEDENDVQEDSALQNSEGVLSEGYPSPAPEDGEAEDPVIGETPEEDPEEDLPTIEFITSGPGRSSSQDGPRRAQSAAARQSYEYTDDYFGQQLGDGTPARALYNKLVETYAGASATPGTTIVSVDSGTTLTTQDSLDALAAFDRDHSEVFWLSPKSFSSSSVTFEISSPWTADGLSSLISQVDSKAQELANAAKSKSNEPLLQVKYVHDWLVNNNTYNTAAAGSASYSSNSPWEAVSALGLSSDGPVCEGYARAFKLVCDKLNIHCVLVSGQGNGGDHMWNYVQLDGIWYFIDVTWDDPSNVEMLSFEHFLLGGSSKHVNNSQFIHSESSGTTIYNKEFSYPALGGAEYDYMNKLGVASVKITASPEADGTVNLENIGETPYYKVPADGTRDITLTVQFLDGEGNSVSLPNDLCAVRWTPINNITLTDNKDNTATLSLSGATSGYTGIPLTVTFIRNKWEKVSTIYYTQGEPTPASSIKISCDTLTPGADGKYVVELPATGSSSNIFKALDSDNKPLSNVTWSVSPADKGVSFLSSAMASLTVTSDAELGEYTVTATSATGDTASVTVVVKKAEPVPKSVTLSVANGFMLHIPDETGSACNVLSCEAGFIDQYGEWVNTNEILDKIALSAKVTGPSPATTDVTGSFDFQVKKLTSGQKEIQLKVTNPALAEGNYSVAVTWNYNRGQATGTNTFFFNTSKFTFSNWPEVETLAPAATITYGMTWAQIFKNLQAQSYTGGFGADAAQQLTGKLYLSDEDASKAPAPGEQTVTLYYRTDAKSNSDAGYSYPAGAFERSKVYTVTIPKPQVSLTIHDAEMTYGETLPQFSFTADQALPEGAIDLDYTVKNQNGDTQDITQPLLPGTYQITGAVKAGSSSDYDVTAIAPGTLTVNKASATLAFEGSTTVSLSDLTAHQANLSGLPGLPDKVKVTYGGKTVEATPQIAWASKGSSVADVLKQFADNGSLASATAYLTAAITLPEELANIVEVTSNTLEYPVLVTGKNVATITPKAGLDLSKTYDGQAVTKPSASDFTITGKEGALTPGVDEFTVSFRVKGGSEIEAPKDKGDYTLVVTFANNDYLGTYEADFTISPLEAQLEWAGAGARTYDGTASNVTATVGNLVSGDAVTVTVTGGTEKNAGSYTATASGLAGAAAGNYVLPEANTQPYTIDKKARTVKPSELTLLPGSLSGTLAVDGLIAADTDSAEDRALTLAFASGADNTIVSLNSATGVVTALKNGTTILTVSAAETTNYQAIAPTQVAVAAFVTPVTGATAAGDTGDQLVASLEGNTVKVTGFVAKQDQAITVTLTLAGGGLTQTPSADGSTITVNAGDIVVGTYTVDLSGVKAVPQNVTIQPGTNPAPAVSDGIAQENQSAAADAAANLAPEASGLTGAASDELVKAGEDAAAGAEGKAVVVETQLVVTVKDYVPTGAEKVLKLEIAPQYTVKVDNQVVKTTPITALPASITISVKIPDGLFTNMANVYVRHHLKNGGTEILKTSWNGTSKVLSWLQGSFSQVDIFEDARTATVTFKGDTTQTIVYTPDMVGQALPASKDGWKYEGKTYTTMTDELLKAISDAGGTATLTPAVSTPVTPPPVNPGKPGGNTPSTPSGGSSSSSSSSSGTPGTIYTSSSSSGGSYSVSAPKPSNGSVSLSSGSARPGATVTITPKPNQGYELDTLTVLDKDGSRVQVQEKDGKYTFTMPKSKVTVEATFRPIGESGTPAFADLPAGYWAENAILWASQNGYMNGTSSTTFNPDGIITRQQMWMILARLNGRSPADFAGARAWAMEAGVSDGTNGGSAMSRQQMVTFLHRYGQMKGYALTGSTELGSFPDGSAVSGYAQEPLSWAVANGIVAGTSQGTLNPGGTATRAQFAVILQRFYQNVVEA